MKSTVPKINRVIIKTYLSNICKSRHYEKSQVEIRILRLTLSNYILY